jgi:uncharacterized protein YjbI with pentapeptide repeats
VDYSVSKESGSRGEGAPRSVSPTKDSVKDARPGAPALSTTGEGVESNQKTFNIDEIPISIRREIKTQQDLDEVLAAHGRWIEGVFDLETFVPGGRAHLAELDLRSFVLRGRNLSGANLSKACLQEMDLRDVNFTTANLVGAQLSCAQLAGAKFRGAKLQGADLRGADLSESDLTGADLSQAILKSEH